jgi:diguanylate cyclase (GGDEF)-like protein
MMNEKSNTLPLPAPLFEDTLPLPAPLLEGASFSRLLVVDDQPINIQALYQIFHGDHEVFMATNGQQALEFCQQDPPDLILLDVMMPNMDGLEVCRRLKAHSLTREVPVIFVTAQESPDEETRALEAGAVDFITKPVNPAVVRARVRTHLTLKRQADLLRSLAFVDGLTGVANRRRFDDSLQREWRRSRRNGASLALLLIDVDHFKQFNDCYGHLVGDSCLQAVAGALKANMGRPHDLAARYGGEEFACLLPETHLAGALAKAEELRQAVQALNIPHALSSIATVVTISIGVAAVVPMMNLSPDQLLSAADEQLYKAKHSGRNRVCGVDIHHS